MYYVDGYNVLHKSTRLRPLLNRDLETARDALIDQIAAYCAATGAQVTIVFDGRGMQVPESVSHHRGVPGLEVLYSPSHLTADAVIERRIYEAADRLRVVVVSNDRGLRDLCRGMGALTMEADHFLKEVGAARADTSAVVRNTHRNTGMPHMDERLDPETLARLEKLRKKL